ncbi:metallophosphoesterase family protein [Bacillus massilinigeriensis]|uniref:metallophosphoesterase family protein n=1 Tax=Bacillus massilionigeriensis TaxID=1805475 RepID=UPI00096B1DA2|nr:DNA repair exonuclease [Bacillus massilionigeriensis]
MKEISFIHAADLHLDSPMIGWKDLPQEIFQRLQESTFTAFHKIIDAAINYQVDFIILAGDLFDGEDRSVRAQSRLRKELERLESHHINAYIIHGNHDHLSGTWAKLKMPSNVKVFGKEMEVMTHISKDGTSVHLYGFSYPKRHVVERKVMEYQKEDNADFHIGILHGNLEGHSEHSNYAPFQLTELIEKDFDYWALGHIHKRTILSESPPVVYPGNIQGRNRKENGIKGCYYVQLTEARSRLQFVETSDVIWLELEIDGRSLNNFHLLYQGCRESMDSIRQEGMGYLIRLSVRSANLEDTQMNLDLQQELLEALQEEEKDEESFVWPVSVQIEEEIRWDRSELSKLADFFNELFEVIDEYQDFESSLSTLFNHPTARKFIDPLSVEDKVSLLKEAENLLVEQLLSNK